MSKKRLIEGADIRRMLAEEHRQALRSVIREMDLYRQGGEENLVVTPDLKVRHRESGLLYTVDAVSPNYVSLRTPEGEVFMISAKEFEKDYNLD